MTHRSTRLGIRELEKSLKEARAESETYRAAYLQTVGMLEYARRGFKLDPLYCFLVNVALAGALAQANANGFRDGEHRGRRSERRLRLGRLPDDD